ncbi:MAG: hypothetical protein QW828_07390, partial [Candidatus Bathyarchaeia archaeon]
TGQVLLKLEVHATLQGRSPFDPGYVYHVNVEKGLRYLFANAYSQQLSIQVHDGSNDDPDMNGDGLGAYFHSTVPDGDHSNYETSLALMAIVCTGAPTRIVDAGIFTGQTYRDVAVNIIDFLAYGQVDGDIGRGGWTYGPMDNSGSWSDNSNSGFVTMAFDYAQAPLASPPKLGGFGLTIPAFVKSELNIWIGYIQNTGQDVDGGLMPGSQADGGSGYSTPDSWVNILKTGSMLQQMALIGDTAATPRVQRAIAFLVRHWNDPDISLPPFKGLAGWRGTGKSLYLATFTVMLGLTALNLERIDGIDWYDDFATAIVQQQEPQGSWPDFTEFEEAAPIPRTLTTAWALLTLEKASPHATLYSSAPVGGLSLPVNRLGLLTPYLVLLGLAAALVAARRNRRNA